MMISLCMWNTTSKNSNLLHHQFLANITEINQSTGLTITSAFGYLTTLIQSRDYKQDTKMLTNAEQIRI